MERVSGPMMVPGLKAGAMVREALEQGRGVRRPPPIICPNGCGPMRVDSYVLYRPDRATCAACGETWEDAVQRFEPCLTCGWEPTEGLGCVEHVVQE